MNVELQSSATADNTVLLEEVLFTVTDIKQYAYCPRVVFYERCLPKIRPRTHNMDLGKDEHNAEQKRAVRRTLTKYEISGGRREFDVVLVSHRHHLRGLVDEVVYGVKGEIIPVDHKLTDKVSANHKLQLAAYALLLEEAKGGKIQRGFVYLIGCSKLVEVTITPALREQVLAVLSALFETVTQERMPDPTNVTARCVGCEFRRFCNDI
jgi:CRISPR-associated exonuclease Cas4